jgi:nucleotide-binding universal stress UspA family protein
MFSRHRSPVVRGYRRLLVPVVDNPETETAIDVACRLAAERGAAISAVAVIEVPPLLPLDCHLADEEEEANRLLERAGATGDSFGVKVSPRIVRSREAGAAIVDEAVANDVELIVIGAARKRLQSTGALALGSTVRHVLTAAPCRVLVVAARPESVSRSAAEDEAVRPIRPAA